MNWPKEQSLNPNRRANDFMLSVVVEYSCRASAYFPMLCGAIIPPFPFFHSQTCVQFRLMLFQVHPETVGVQAKFLRHLCHGHSTLFQSGYGVSVFGGSGRVIFPNGRPVHGLAFLVRDAFPLTNQVLVPSLQVVVETSYRYAGLFGYFSG